MESGSNNAHDNLCEQISVLQSSLVEVSEHLLQLKYQIEKLANGEIKINLNDFFQELNHPKLTISDSFEDLLTLNAKMAIKKKIKAK